jgi:hypothetical protein
LNRLKVGQQTPFDALYWPGGYPNHARSIETGSRWQSGMAGVCRRETG